MHFKLFAVSFSILTNGQLSVSEDYEFVLFVDEAGDVGTKTAEQGDRGSSEWFCLSGVVVARKFEGDIPNWMENIKRSYGSGDVAVGELHYKKLKPEQRVGACQAVGQLPIKAFVVASHKANMRGYQNPRAAKLSSKSAFYNFCLRILLERVTATVAKTSVNVFGGKRKMRIAIAKTGAIRYSETKAYIEYLRHQTRNGTTYLKAGAIDHEVLDIWQIDEVRASTVEGCQLADIVASAFYNALNPKAKHMVLEPAEALRPILATRHGRVSRHGLQLLPWDQNIPPEYRPVFEQFGYGWAPQESGGRS